MGRLFLLGVFKRLFDFPCQFNFGGLTAFPFGDAVANPEPARLIDLINGGVERVFFEIRPSC